MKTKGKWLYFIAVIVIFGIFGTLVLREIWSLEKSENDQRRTNSIADNDTKFDQSPSKSLVVKEEIWKPPQVLLKKDKDVHRHKKENNIIDGQGMDSQWQTVEGINNHKFFVYSAYYDTRDIKNPIIRVIAITLSEKSVKVKCRMYFNKTYPEIHMNNEYTKNENHLRSFRDVQASISIINEHYKKKYSASYVLCPLKPHSVFGSTENLVPDYVSILPFSSSSTSNLNATNKLYVINSRNGGTGTYQVNKTDSIGVCVKPMYLKSNQILDLIEFIEFNKILGVSKFTMYNRTMSDKVSCVLNYYKNQDKSVSIMSWNLRNVEPNIEIHDEGHMASVNDCVYRNMNVFRYLMPVDLDEFIIPHMNETLQDMIGFLNSKEVEIKKDKKVRGGKLASSYNFQNSFFYIKLDGKKSHVPKSIDENLSTRLRVLRHTRRGSKFNSPGDRSKYICIPQRIKEAGQHYIWEYQKGVPLQVATNIGFLHHYRNSCEFKGKNICTSETSQVDPTVNKYKETLLKNIKLVLYKLIHQCKLGPSILSSNNLKS